MPPRVPAAACPAMDKREERQRIATLVILFLIVIFFWVAFYQNFFGLTLFAERSTVVLKWLRPETYQFFEPFFILALTPLLLALFSRLNRSRQGALDAGQDPPGHAHHEPGHDRHGLRRARRRQPGPEHHVAGLAHRDLLPRHPGRDPHLADGPVVRLQGRPAEDRRADDGRLVRGHAAGSYGSGMLGKFYSSFAHHEFFLFLAALMAVAAVLVAVFLKKLNRFTS